MTYLNHGRLYHDIGDACPNDYVCMYVKNLPLSNANILPPS